MPLEPAEIALQKYNFCFLNISLLSRQHSHFFDLYCNQENEFSIDFSFLLETPLKYIAICKIMWRISSKREIKSSF